MKLRLRPVTFSPVWFHSNSCCFAQKLFYPCQRGAPSASWVEHTPFCKIQQLMLITELEMRVAALQGHNSPGQQSLELWGKGRPGFGGVSHRAELNLALCWEAFSDARMPAPTTEVEYHLPNHSSHGRQRLVVLAKFWLNPGAQGQRRDTDSF